MSISRALSVLVLGLMPAVAASQTAPAPSPAPRPPGAQAVPADASTGPDTWAGTIDFGLRGTWTEGDAARYERYRDLGDGLFLEVVRLHKEHKGWLLDFDAGHVGRRD